MIENYKELLFTILNTDEENEKKKLICVYDTKDNDRLVAIFNSVKSCAKFFNVSSAVIRLTMSRNILRKKDID